MDLKSTLNPLSVAASLGCVIMTSAQPVRADVIVIPELQAATLFGASAANNNSSSGPGIFVGSDGAGNPKRGLIEFNIAGSLPSDATITSASLSLVLGQVAGSGGVNPGDPTPRTIRLFDVTTNWAGGTNGVTTPNPPGSFPSFSGTGQGFPPNVGDATWNFSKVTALGPPVAGTPWLTPGGGGDFSSTESADTLVSNVLGTYTWGSTAQMVSDVQGWLDGTLPNFGWLLKNDSEAVPTSFRAFDTTLNPELAPELTVTFDVPAAVPEPSTLGLTALGALAILSLRRRQHRINAASATERIA
jgi:PEP-CTERM motif